jgi:mono/diheme cytochrome c family protein
MKTILALTALLLAAGGAAAQGPAPAPPGDAAHGKQLYMSVGCYQCHGTSGEGGSDRTAPRIAPGLIAYQFFINQLRSPQQRMPLYTAVVLPDKDAADIYAYLKTIPPAKKLADIPLLNQ